LSLQKIDQDKLLLYIKNADVHKDPSKYGKWLELKWDRDERAGDLNVTVLVGNQKV